MRVTYIICLGLALSACRPHSKYMIVKPGKNPRHPSFEFYYSNKIVRKDSCLVFMNLDNDTCRLCDDYVVFTE